MYDTLGTPANPQRLGSSPRSRVWRIELHGQPAIVKQIIGGPEPGLDNMDAGERHTREATALRLAARAHPPVAPALIASDPAHRLLVLEQLPNRRTGAWPIRYAETLARLHAVTTPADTGALPPWHGPTPADADAFLALAAALGIAVRADAETELADLLDRLDPTGHHDLIHGDPCPGNDRHTPTGTRLLDFEAAALGNGLAELAYLRIGLPTCWNATALPASLVDEAETAYLTTRGLTGGRKALLDACAGWLIRGDALVERAHRGQTDHLARLTGENWHWGAVSARDRLTHRLTVAAAFEHMPAFAHLCQKMHQHATTLWPNLRPLPSRLITWV
ncbi:phosphotransferase [Acrocarpospora sp. B8E8]|uniref:phosphotransferase family protein n=1 Tax=Acrocarpospora sp. B8E8 TaxID=3153572 RepID=UPI00325D9A27